MLLVFFGRVTRFCLFTFVHKAENVSKSLKVQNFPNNFFVSLTEFARASSLLTLFSQSFLVICVFRI